MSEQKRYTEQEMRDTAQCLHYNSPTKLTIEAAAMLRQAADAEEELARALKNEKALELRVDYWRRNHNSLKSRLEAVVADAEKENAKLRVDADLYKGAAENWERRAREAEARLEAVVKECGNTQLAYKGMEAKIYPDSLVSAVDAILRVARGESGAE